MTPSRLALLLESTRSARQWALYFLFTNIVALAAAYVRLVSPAFLPQDILNPAYLNFAEYPQKRPEVAQLFADLNAYDDDPQHHRRPHADLLAGDETQFGLVVHVKYLLRQQEQAAPDGLPRYRYDTDVMVRLSPGTLAAFIALESALAVLLCWGLFHKRSAARAEFEDQVLRDFYFPVESASADTPPRHDSLQHVMSRFHVVAQELAAPPRADHLAWNIRDEYDVQHALCALLRMHFDNVKTEEATPSLAGSSTRIDFLLVNERTGIETKMTRDSLSDKKLGEQLLLDLLHFPSHPSCDSLIFFIYDPSQRIRNPGGLRDDVVSRAPPGIAVEVIFSPPR